MTVDLVVHDDAVELQITGWFDRAMCVSSGVRIPFADIVRAEVTSWDTARAQMGWRVGGTYWPGKIATGWYMVRDNGDLQKGVRQLWAVFKYREKILVIDTKLDRPCRLVIGRPDADVLAAEINERLAPAPMP